MLKLFFNTFAIGMMTCLSFYYYALFIERKEKLYKYFSLHLLFAGLFILITTNVLSELIDYSSYFERYLFSINVIIGFFCIYYITKFSITLLKLNYYRVYKIAFALFFLDIIIVWTSNILLGAEFYSKYIRPVTMGISVIVGVTIATTILLSIFNKYKKSKESSNPKSTINLYFIAGIIVIITYFPLIVLSYSIDYLDFFNGNFIGLALVMLLFSVALSKQFNEEYKNLKILKGSLEQKVLERTAELNTVLSFKSNLLTITAHHTKTPLTLIRNGFDSLFTIYPELKKNKQLKMLKRNADLMTRDIVNIFDMAQLEQGKSIVGEKRKFNLSEMLNDKVELFSDSAMSEGIFIKKVIDDDIFMEADDLALNRVIDNLLDNGIKYCDKDSIIKVMLKGNDSKIVLVVEDNGPGMSEEELSHIFERYYQIERDKQVSSGLGLGLALTKEIVEELGGTIGVESELEAGTRFRVELERAIPGNIEKYELTKPVDGSSIVVEELKTHINGKNIMLVEDEPELLLYLRDVLGEEYNITPAVNGRDALSKLEECKPDLIISDIRMAEMDGLKLKQNLPAEYKSTPFIFITAKTKESDKLEGLALGANDYIYKPFNIEEVKIKVERFIKADEDRGKEALEVIIDLAKKELKHIKGRKSTFEESCAKYGLTDREVEVVLALHETETNKEAAKKLFISNDTMKTHIRRINSKTGAKNKHDLFKKLFC